MAEEFLQFVALLHEETGLFRRDVVASYFGSQPINVLFDGIASCAIEGLFNVRVRRLNVQQMWREIVKRRRLLGAKPLQELPPAFGVARRRQDLHEALKHDPPGKFFDGFLKFFDAIRHHLLDWEIAGGQIDEIANGGM